MATSFINAPFSGVGTAEAVIYTVPAGKKAILIGCNLANRADSALPIDLFVRGASSDYYVVKSKRVDTGENEEVMRGNKMVLLAGESLVAVSTMATAFDVIASVLEGVS